jgi:hypothetical protein
MAILPTVSRYAVRVLNASRTPVGQLKGIQKLTVIKRFNAVSDWGIQVDGTDSVAQQLATQGYNLEVIRTVFDSRTGVQKASGSLIRGPMLHYEFDKNSNSIIAAGHDEMIWLAARRAWPVNEIYYRTVVNATAGLLRWYRLNETSGTSATDSKSAQTGTYAGTVGYNQRYIVDIGGPCIYFNGTNTTLSLPTTGLPSGNTAWSTSIWFVVNGLQSGNSTLIGWGTAASKQTAAIKMDNTGAFFCDLNGAGTVHTYTPTQGTIHQAWATWDGTTVSFYVDGTLINTATPGALNIVLAFAFIGAYAGGGEKFTGWLGSGEIYNTCVPLATIQANYAAGLTRFVKQAYSVRAGIAESVLRAYVDDNCTANAVVAPNGDARAVPGLSLDTNHLLGASVPESVRFDPFISKDGTGVLQRVALAGGDIGFKVIPSGANRLFTVYQPNDKHTTVLFSDMLNSVSNYSFSRTAPDWEAGGNAVIVAGQGDGTARQFIETTDNPSEAAWGRFETFQDARDLATVDALLARGAGTIAQYSDTDTFSAVPIQGQNTIYQVDWDLGDIVTVVANGQTRIDKVRNITIDVAGSKETITPRIGAPGTEYADSGDTVISAGKHRDMKLHERIAGLEARK